MEQKIRNWGVIAIINKRCGVQGPFKNKKLETNKMKCRNKGRKQNDE